MAAAAQSSTTTFPSGTGGTDKEDDAAVDAASIVAACGSDKSDAGDKKDDPIYCEACTMWLNGPVQWTDHLVGKKHKRKLQELRNLPPTDPVRIRAVREGWIRQ